MTHPKSVLLVEQQDSVYMVKTKLKIKFVFIADKFLNWPHYIESETLLDSSPKHRTEELLKRAEWHLDQGNHRECRSDCILTLKRCLNHRLKMLEDIYGFRQLDLPQKSKDYLALLESIGIVRPIILKKLLEIRNNIEHADEVPPSSSSCRELTDVVWYFLKSSDHLVMRKTTNLNYSRDGFETNYFISTAIKDRSLNDVKINGWLPKSHVRIDTKKLGFIKIDVESFHTKSEWWSKSKLHEDKLDSDTWISGTAILTTQLKHQILKDSLDV